jgi:hypothetical protein
MRFRTAVQHVLAEWQDAYINNNEAVDTPLLLLGKPGIGKTSIGQAAAEAMTAIMQARTPGAPPAIYDPLDLSSLLPEDLGGIPFRTEEEGINFTEFAIRKRLAPFCQPGAYGVLVLDDITQAANAVQIAARQTVLFRRLGDFTISPGVYILITGNRREDKSGASTLPAHFRNSTCIVGVEPEIEEWAEWYGRQANSIPSVAGFLRFRPSHLAQTPSEADKAGAFATPRSWAKLGRKMAIAEEVGVSLEIMKGCVGEGVATEFRGFLNTRDKLVDPGKVLRDPKAAMPNPGILNTPDKAFAMITGLGETAAQWRAEAASKSDQAGIKRAAVAFMRAIAWASNGSQDRSNKEYISVGVSTYTSNGGEITDLIQAARSERDDPLVAATLNFLVSAVKTTPRK